MRAVLQRVTSAQVLVRGRQVGRIGAGLLVFVGVGKDDDSSDIDYIAGKVLGVRVFEDDEQRMNRSVTEMGGQILVVSQFTLYGDCRRGRRPSFDQAAPPAEARAIYENLVTKLRQSDLTVETGEFQAMMDVELVNDGPVTLLLESPGH
jgi:D-tyrosyl-tRNA(Tyr) deacylase